MVVDGVDSVHSNFNTLLNGLDWGAFWNGAVSFITAAAVVVIGFITAWDKIASVDERERELRAVRMGSLRIWLTAAVVVSGFHIVACEFGVLHRPLGGENSMAFTTSVCFSCCLCRFLRLIGVVIKSKTLRYLIAKIITTLGVYSYG